MVDGLAKGTGRAILAPTRLIGKDAKIAALARETHKEDQDGAESSFDAKKIGKKPVFRPILTSPFTVKWPTTTQVYADVILHSLLEFLQRKDLIEHFSRDNLEIPKRSSRKTKEKNNRRRFRLEKEILKQHGIFLPPASAFAISEGEEKAETKGSEKTPFLCGINSITRHLETQIRHTISKSDEASTSSTELHNPMFIFVCLSDIDPPALVSHFPLLVSTYNAVLKKQVILISLPEGSEKQLTEAIHLRRCSCISIDSSKLEEAAAGSFRDITKKVKDAKLTPTRLEWLERAVDTLRAHGLKQIDLIDPQIKHLRSSAPLDMNAVKMYKRDERVERKAKRKMKSSISKAMAIKKPEKLTPRQKRQRKAERQRKNGKKKDKEKKMPRWKARKEEREQRKKKKS